jgi:hypothetical protein
MLATETAANHNRRPGFGNPGRADEAKLLAADGQIREGY